MTTLGLKTGVTLTSSGGVVTNSLPLDTSGRLPRFVRVTATAPCYVRFSDSGTSAVAGDMLVQPSDATMACVTNMRQVSMLPVSGAATLIVSADESGSWEYGVTRVFQDVVASAVFAAGPRKINSTYAGPAMRVRRDSDNLEADIGFNADGTLNETALLAHVGSGSGFVSKWYDQSGNGRDLAQATAASQPRIVNAGTIDRLSTRPAVRTDGVAQTMATGSFTVAQPFTRSSVHQFLATTAGKHFLNGSSGFDVTLRSNASSQIIMGAGTDLVLASSYAVNDKATIVEVFNGANSFGTYNGALSSGNAGTNNLTGVEVGGWLGGTGGYTAAMVGDILIFPAALITTDRQIIESNQRVFYGTP